jgi:DNA-binding winged helix-turn-helix (wHTH) protein/predicted ATPase
MGFAQEAIRFGRYRLHPVQGLIRGATEVRLTPKSLSVLWTLVAHAGEVVTKDELFRAVWPDTAVSDAALTSCIQELRQALRDSARQPRYIQTLHRRGFRFLLRPGSDSPRHAGKAFRSTPGPVRLLVGRDGILQQLRSAQSAAGAGVRQAVFITGEPGIGKTALVDAFLTDSASRSAWRISRADCVERQGAGEAYQPLLEAMTRMCRQTGGELVLSILRRAAPTWLAQLPAVQTPLELRALQRRTAGATPDRMLRELNDGLEAIAARTPLVLCLEDLHWSDQATLDFIAAFARRPERARILLLGTFRPTDVAHLTQSAQTIADGLQIRELCMEIALRPLDWPAVASYVSARFPAMKGSDAALASLARHVHAHTEGNPLFVVNVLNDLVARGILIERENGWTTRDGVDATSLEVPRNIRRTIEHQLDRLDPAERSLLEVASAAGSVCCAATVAAGANLAVHDVERTLGALARREQFVREGRILEWPDGTVSATVEFLHALYREVIYSRLSPSRRLALHQLIGARLEAAYGDQAAEAAAELAAHFERARDTQRAIAYYQHAAEADRSRSAHAGAQGHFRRALSLLQTLPPSTQRDAREVALRIGLGGELMATRGFAAPEVEDSYARARELCRRIDTTPHLFPTLWGLWLFYFGRGPVSTASEFAVSLVELARQSNDPAHMVQAHHAQWGTALAAGDLSAVETHVQAGLTIYSSDRDAALATIYGSHDAGVCGAIFRAWALAMAGRTDTAARAADEAIAHARELAHPFTLTLALETAGGVHLVRRDAAAALPRASEAAELAREHGFRLMRAWASVYEGWARADLGNPEAGLALMREGVAAARATGSTMFLDSHLALLAETELRYGLKMDAARSLDEAFAVATHRGGEFSTAERYRLRGALTLASSRDADACASAEKDFHAAVEASRRQGAHLLALRASIGLASMLTGTARSGEAHALLAEARAQVSEGEELPDVVEAAALLDATRHGEARRPREDGTPSGMQGGSSDSSRSVGRLPSR